MVGLGNVGPTLEPGTRHPVLKPSQRAGAHLGPAKAAERRVGGLVGAAQASGHAHVGHLVHAVAAQGWVGGGSERPLRMP